jgi:predicted transcriptional regulator
MTARLTIAIEEQDKAQLQTIADFRNQSVEAVVSEALRDLIEHDTWFRTAVEQGLQDMREGRTLPHEDVVARARARRAAHEDASKV